MNIDDTHPRRRFWVEAAAATFFAALTVLTLAVPDWIEATSGFSPDSGNGGTEWALLATVACATVTIAILAAREWKRGSVTTA